MAVLDFAVVMLAVNADRQMTLVMEDQLLILVFTVLMAVIALEIPVVKPFNCCQMTKYMTPVIIILATSLRTLEIPAYRL